MLLGFLAHAHHGDLGVGDGHGGSLVHQAVLDQIALHTDKSVLNILVHGLDCGLVHQFHLQNGGQAGTHALLHELIISLEVVAFIGSEIVAEGAFIDRTSRILTKIAENSAHCSMSSFER